MALDRRKVGKGLKMLIAPTSFWLVASQYYKQEAKPRAQKSFYRKSVQRGILKFYTGDKSMFDHLSANGHLVCFSAELSSLTFRRVSPIADPKSFVSRILVEV